MTAIGYIIADLTWRDQLDVLLDVDGEPLQDRVEDAARLARRHHVGVERVERVGVLAHRVGQRRAAFDVGPGLQDDARRSSCPLPGSRGSRGTAPAAGPASIMTENWRVKMARFFAATFLLCCAPAFTGASAFALAGVIRVTRICSRRSAATAPSMVSATRSPLTTSPAARPSGVGKGWPCPSSSGCVRRGARPTGARRGPRRGAAPRGRVHPGPGDHADAPADHVHQLVLQRRGHRARSRS